MINCGILCLTLANENIQKNKESIKFRSFIDFIYIYVQKRMEQSNPESTTKFKR